jgi:hypothetical protein
MGAHVVDVPIGLTVEPPDSRCCAPAAPPNGYRNVRFPPIPVISAQQGMGTKC